MKKSLWLYVLLALVVTFGTLYFQDSSGPTSPKDVNIQINGKAYDFELPRTHDISKPCVINLTIPDQEVSASIRYRRYPTKDEYTTMAFTRNEDTLSVELPLQPKAGKLEYIIDAKTGEETIPFVENGRVVIRFKGHVPTSILIIHIFLMFASYFFSIFAGLLAIFKQRKYQFYALIALILLGIGGLIFGPIVQKYAFDVWWSGFPNGTDLTDNKLLIAFIAWLVAWLLNIKKERRWLAILAMVIHITVYSIPHSARGSEFDYEKGEIGTTEKMRD